MTKVLKCDCAIGSAYVSETVTLGSSWYIQFDTAVPTSCFTAIAPYTQSGYLFALYVGTGPGPQEGFFLGDAATSGSLSPPPASIWTGNAPGGAIASEFSADEWHTVKMYYNGTTLEWKLDGITEFSYSTSIAAGTWNVIFGGYVADVESGEVYYIANVKVGTTEGGSEIFSNDLASPADLADWTATSGDVSIVQDPFAASDPAVHGRRVGIAFDDDPLEPDPTWTYLDDSTVFSDQLVAGYDTKNGRQTLLSQTETGTATVYLNDRSGLFDDRNNSSPYQGKLSGKQIKLQLWNPVTEVWEPQFRGWIDDWGFDIDGSSVDANGDPINASLRIDCVDVFDFLNLYGLTPGLDGHVPPAGMEDGVWYDTAPIQDRFIKILDDVGIDPTRYHLARGNVNVIGVKYDPDESALTALRDAADAEIPFIANIYVDRYGKFIFRGRYSRFDPDFVSSEPGSDWDFQRWPLGDGKAIEDDPSRGQIRLLEYARSKANVINAAIAWPQGIAAADMPNQVFASTLSITAHGKHQAPPMSDLLTCEPTSSGYDKYVETAKFAELLVENKKAPHFEITALQLKSMRPDHPSAEATWGAICGADIDHIVNVAAGYPGGTGLLGDSVNDDHYIEGRSLTVRPLNPTHDYVELELDVSPAVWSMDINEVFPPAGNFT